MSEGNETTDCSLRKLFHLIKEVLPEDQEILTIPPNTKVGAALKLMNERNFSQLPVVAGGKTVLGVFSFRSFAIGLLKIPKRARPDALNLDVEDFIEDLKYISIRGKLTDVLDEFELKDGVLVGSEEKLQGIVTATDALKYFYRIASPYVMLCEIELAIRELIRQSVTQEELLNCIEKSLKNHYETIKGKVPASLDEMTFSDYVMILRREDTWHKFCCAFGGNRQLAYTRLETYSAQRRCRRREST
jgi:CBS domain-containing protein